MAKVPDRFSDGSQVIIGGKVVYDSEAAATDTPSQVGESDAPGEQRARLRDAAETLPDPDFDADDDPFSDEPDDDDQPEDTEDP